MFKRENGVISLIGGSERSFSGGWYDAGDFNKCSNWHAGYLIVLLHAYLGNSPPGPMTLISPNLAMAFPVLSTKVNRALIGW